MAVKLGEKDISSITGFDVRLSQDGKLSFGSDVIKTVPDMRKMEDMKPVLLYPNQEGPEVFYLMYRGTGLQKDKLLMENQGLRYDITVIYPGKVGQEYVKTFGHYHPRVPGQELTYPEVYQVLSGKAHFLLQKGGELTGEVEDFAVADFEAGDILIIPPFYGHVTVNPGDEPLVMANWIARDFVSEYGPIRARKGMAYYDVEYKGKSIFMPNDSYRNHPRPRLLKSLDYPELGLTRGKSMYISWQQGAKLDFLLKPSLYLELWETLSK